MLVVAKPQYYVPTKSEASTNRAAAIVRLLFTSDRGRHKSVSCLYVVRK